jgi:hypothetical protein
MIFLKLAAFVILSVVALFIFFCGIMVYAIATCDDIEPTDEEMRMMQRKEFYE